jgi:hypothetical protein
MSWTSNQKIQIVNLVDSVVKESPLEVANKIISLGCTSECVIHVRDLIRQNILPKGFLGLLDQVRRDSLDVVGSNIPDQLPEGLTREFVDQFQVCVYKIQEFYLRGILLQPKSLEVMKAVWTDLDWVLKMHQKYKGPVSSLKTPSEVVKDI